MIDPATSPGPATSQPGTTRRDIALRRAAQELESGFLAEMLKHAGLGKARDAFGGGPGEDQFASFLTRAQADAIVAGGGIGLAESLYHALKETPDAR